MAEFVLGGRQMTIKVPKDLEQEFKDFLDLAQYNIGPEDKLPLKERRVIKLVRKIIGEYSNHKSFDKTWINPGDLLKTITHQ